jgi:hypothetical protein
MALRRLQKCEQMWGKRQWASAFSIVRAQVELHRCWGAVFDVGAPLLDCPAAKKMVLPAHFVLLNKRKIFSIVGLHKSQFTHIIATHLTTISTSDRFGAIAQSSKKYVGVPV